MKTIFDAAPEGGGAKSLLVILPGMRDDPEDVVRHGFVKAVWENFLGRAPLPRNGAIAYSGQRAMGGQAVAGTAAGRPD
ncbi:MAG: hypothetical protein ACKVQA_08210 [Burkholderiales bacterium]